MATWFILFLAFKGGDPFLQQLILFKNGGEQTGVLFDFLVNQITNIQILFWNKHHRTLWETSFCNTHNDNNFSKHVMFWSSPASTVVPELDPSLRDEWPIGLQSCPGTSALPRRPWWHGVGTDFEVGPSPSRKQAGRLLEIPSFQYQPGKQVSCSYVMIRKRKPIGCNCDWDCQEWTRALF